MNEKPIYASDLNREGMDIATRLQQIVDDAKATNKSLNADQLQHALKTEIERLRVLGSDASNPIPQRQGRQQSGQTA